MQLEGKVALVTGAGGHLGSVIAGLMAEDGAHVALLDINSAATSDLKRDLTAMGHRSMSLSADLTDDDQLRSAVERVLQEFGRIDILVNNAAVAGFAPLEDIRLTDWDFIMSVNLRAVFSLSQLVGRAMIAQGGGVIVNVASIAGHMASPENVAYGVSKAGVRALTEQIAVEWGPRNIRCNAVSPGQTNWFMTGTIGDADLKERQAQRIPLRRVGSPEDFAEVVLFLASSRARYVNGVTILVDGGYAPSLLAQQPRPRQGK